MKEAAEKPFATQAAPAQRKAAPETGSAARQAGWADAGPPLRSVAALGFRMDTGGAVQRLAELQPAAATASGGPARAASGGLPEALRSGIECLSGFSMEGVRVHRNSARPAQVGALAFAQGRDIHLGPGQDRHLPHEAWHVVQQAQGRVRATGRAGSVPLNDDAALEREADRMGATARAAGGLAAGSDLREPSDLEGTISGPPPIQRSVFKGRTRFSFLDTYDLDGNPYLATKDGDNPSKQWKLNKEQPGLAVTEVDSLFTPFDEGSMDRVFHNISFGRPQALDVGGVKSYFNPFKSYQFGAETRPEVAVFTQGEGDEFEKGKLYKDFKASLKPIVPPKNKEVDLKRTREVMEETRSQMLPVILGEEYRTPGAKAEFEERFDPLSQPAKRRKRFSNKDVEEVTTKLPYAGSGGKAKGREVLRQKEEKRRKLKKKKKKLAFREDKRKLARRSPSPERDSPGRHWEEVDF